MPRLNIFFDCEFSNFSDLHPISLGLISEDENHSIYLEFNDYPINSCSDFVKQQVLPLLHNKNPLSQSENFKLLIDWIQLIPHNEINFISDYHGDIIILQRLFSLNPSINSKKITYSILFDCLKQVSIERGFYSPAKFSKAGEQFNNALSKIFHDSKLQHQALFDANANLQAWKETINFLKN